MDNQQFKKVKLKIHGMHCQSCEVLVERKFKNVEGVQKVNVSHHNGKAEIFCSKEPNLQELNNLVKPDGYNVSFWHERNDAVHTQNHKNTWQDYLQIGIIFLLIIDLYYILNRFNLIPSIGISQQMSYGLIFLIGLFAAMSTCIAVVGGLLLAITGRYNELHPDLTGAQKFKPHIYFNTGRIAGYTAFGAVIGGIGSVLTLSARTNGYLIIFVSLVMLMLGFQLLHLFPFLRRFSPKMPKFIGHKIHNLSEKGNKGASFILGALTFFLPCGFTQALQLYVLAIGDWKVGALTMFVFSLGTLPALISLSAIASFAKGAFQKYFLKFAGVLVILLALFNINSGLNLTGSNFNLVSAFTGSNNSSGQSGAPTAKIIGGKQIVKMTVNGYTYTPNQFTVINGVPVEWQIDGADAVGCGQVLVMPTLGISKYLSKEGITTINFTPTETGAIPFNCSMGMMTRGSSFTVVSNTTGVVGTTITPTTEDTAGCDNGSCQKLAIEVSREYGIQPSSLTAKKGVPIELTVDSKITLGGCMSVWVIPDYNVTIPMKVGISKASFTPTKTGPINITCSMGSRMAKINVID